MTWRSANNSSYNHSPFCRGRVGPAVRRLRRRWPGFARPRPARRAGPCGAPPHPRTRPALAQAYPPHHPPGGPPPTAAWGRPAAAPVPGLRPGRPPGALPAPSGPTIKPPHPRPAGGPLRGLRRAAPAPAPAAPPCGAPHKTAPCTFSAPCINPAPAAHTTAESFPEGVCTGRAVLTPGRDETPCAFSLPGLFLPKKGLHLRSVCGIIL